MVSKDGIVALLTLVSIASIGCAEDDSPTADFERADEIAQSSLITHEQVMNRITDGTCSVQVQLATKYPDRELDALVSAEQIRTDSELVVFFDHGKKGPGFSVPSELGQLKIEMESLGSHPVLILSDGWNYGESEEHEHWHHRGAVLPITQLELNNEFELHSLSRERRLYSLRCDSPQL